MLCWNLSIQESNYHTIRCCCGISYSGRLASFGILQGGGNDSTVVVNMFLGCMLKYSD